MKFGWINLFRADIVILLLIPNIVYAVKHKDEKNLCDMVIKMGENHLCKTCKLYPRHVEEFEGLREWSLSLSCPVAAHMVLSCREPVRFEIEENDDDDPLIDEFDDFDFLLFTELEDAREVIFKIVQNRDLTIAKRVQILMSLAKQLQTCLEENRISDMQSIVKSFDQDADAFDDGVDLDDISQRYDFLQETFSVFKKLEQMRDDWQQILDPEKDLLAKGLKSYSAIRTEFVKAMEQEEWWPVFAENYLMSFLYTYFCGAVYDDWIDTKVMLSVFSLVFTEEFIMNAWNQKGSVTLEEAEKIAYRFVREVEHSDINLNTLEEFLHAVLFSSA